MYKRQIIVYDSAKYPIFQRFGESVIVPPEGVVGIISVKKHLHDTDVAHELSVLKKPLHYVNVRMIRTLILEVRF